MKGARLMPNATKRTSIRARILRLSLISVAVTMISLSGMLITQVNYVGISAYKNEITALSAVYTDALNTEVSNVHMQIQSAAANDAINITSDIDELKTKLSDLAKTTSFKDFSIADQDGNTISNTNLSDREYFQNALTGKTYISSPVIRKTDSSLVIMVATPMPNGKILYGALDAAALSKGLSNSALGDGGNIYVVDKYGEVMASSDPSRFGSKLDLGFELTADNKEFGNNMYYNYEAIDDTDGWSIVIVGNMSNVKNTTCMCLIICIALGIGLCGLAITVSVKVSKQIVTPIITTTQRLKQLAKGDVTSDVQTYNRRDETEDLSKALNTVCCELGQYIQNIVITANEMAEGNFTYEHQMCYCGDFESISVSFARIHDMLKSTITQLKNTADSVKSGTEQIANGSQTLAEGTTCQATSADELSSMLNNISEAVQHTANSSDEASALSNKCAQLIQHQNEAMSNMLTAMDAIKEKSEAISNVIKIIEDIAFQTNILALNASIEAARAGAAGRGFAVVATEVGNLAAKSAESANTTRELIVSTLESVQTGATIADETAASQREVMQYSEQSAVLVKTIADDAEKQAEALKQATIGVENISQVIQANSATAEESAASCEELSAQANILDNEIAKLTA